MPEHEIAKHTKAIFEAAREPNKSWKHKLADIMIEIGIIVFAITLSLLLERWRENAHDAVIEKKFLIGLRNDLTNDIKQLKSDSISYQELYDGWNYFRTTGINKEQLAKDSINKYINTLLGTTEFIPNNSRFEALKTSGQLNVIENDSLQNLILDLYQNKIISLKSTTSYINTFKTQQLVPFLEKNLRFAKDSSNNLEQVIQQPEMQNYLLFGGSGIEAMYRYRLVILQSQNIISLINRQYKN